MREILFRGKRLDDGKWVEGGLLYDEEQNEAYIAEHFEDKSAYLRPIIPETVGQYTGLTDKNGKKIFEGDICQTKGFPFIDDKPFVVEWNCDECSFYWRDVLGTDEFTTGVAENTTIIGNIHDNPELMEEKV